MSNSSNTIRVEIRRYGTGMPPGGLLIAQQDWPSQVALPRQREVIQMRIPGLPESTVVDSVHLVVFEDREIGYAIGVVV